jgi:RNA polymerase sigma factor (sigma-70 family)
MSLDFAQVYEEHVERVYAFVAYRLGSPADAEDLTQLTFERALGAWRRYDERKASVGTWLLAIARNALIDERRRDRAGRETVLSREAIDRFAPSSDGGIEGRLGPDPELRTALARLSGRERELLALRFGGDLRSPEIAKVTRLTTANVQQILSRALRKLRASLEPDDSERSTLELQRASRQGNPG